MYAALVTVTIDPAQLEQAQQALQNEIVPMVSASPGFVAGYWLEPADGQGMSFGVFDTEDHARQAAPPAGASPTPGVTIASVEFRPVVASASAP
jgi:hypothetical protein